MTKSWLFRLTASCALIGLAACSSASGQDASADDEPGVPPPGGVDTPSASSATGKTGAGGADSNATAPEAGLLTAGIWDDNLNFSFFGKYRAAHPDIAGDPQFTDDEYSASQAEFAQRGAHSYVDAAVVIDTTGSMGDELSYLNAEFANISSAIAAKFPGAEQRWALVVYRDTPDTDPGDDYVVQSIDFTSDPTAFAGEIGAQSAGNGGDYPESPELGLEQLKQLSWRTDPSVAKLAFWIGDAPQHDYRGPQMKQAIVDAHAAGIHVYPVSASGTDDLLEMTMRSAALITGGRYLFLTDDSGIGDAHKLPEIPCYYVTRFAKDLVRTISIELSGAYVPPDTADIMRIVGSPTASGQCTTGDGQMVQIL